MAQSPLPDAIIQDEIFLRLHNDGDVFALFRCAATCRQWRRLVAGSSFLCQRWPSPLVGFFARQSPPGTGTGAPLAFVPSGRSSKAATRLNGPSPPFRPLSSFVRDATMMTDSLDGAEPLAWSGSLLLVRIFPDNHDRREPYDNVRLAVCDLLAGTCHMLPELACNCRFAHYTNSHGYAILSSRVSDHRSSSSSSSAGAGPSPPDFSVLMIGQEKHLASYDLHVFTSDDKPAWSTKCFNTRERRVWPMKQPKAVLCRGHAHWLFSGMSSFSILSAEVETGHDVSLTNLSSPAPTPTRWLVQPGDYLANVMDLYLNSLDGLSNANRLTTTANGTLLQLCVYRNDGCRLEMWTRQEAEDGEQSTNNGGDSKWLRTRVIELKLLLSQELAHTTCVCLGERSGKLLVADGSRRMCIVDLETGALEEVTDQFQGHAYNCIVPVEIDWPRFLARWA